MNVDIGERDGEPEELYQLATVVNIACGGHAGDEASMARAVRLAHRSGARIAAHPSYPDREGFGRKSMFLPEGELSDSVSAQCAALSRIAKAAGAEVVGIKPHGALYHDAASSERIARIVLAAAFGVIHADACFVVGPPGEGALGAVAEDLGARYVGEGFADRGYDEAGRLRPRGEPGALLTDPQGAADQAMRLAGRADIETICVHSDTPEALRIARAVESALTAGAALAARRPGS